MDNVVICKNCGKKEYWGDMHWRSGKTYCRACIYGIWQKETSWKPTERDFVYPACSDGVDRTKYYCQFCDTEIPEGDMVCGKCSKEKE